MISIAFVLSGHIAKFRESTSCLCSSTVRPVGRGVQGGAHAPPFEIMFVFIVIIRRKD